MIQKQNLLKRVDQLRFIMAAGVLMLAIGISAITSVNKTSAAALKKAYVRLDNLAAQANSTGRVCFVADVTTTIQSIRITFPTTNGTPDYVPNTTTTNWTFNTSNLDTSLSENAVTNIGTNAASVSGKQVVVNFTSTFFTPANTTNTYCFNWAGATTLALPSAGATESSPGLIETFSGTGASGLISSSQFSEPQTVSTPGTAYGVTATVPPSISFTVGTTTDAFGNLQLSTLNSTPGKTATISTNAAGGWILYAKDGQAAGNTCTKGSLWSPTRLYCLKSSSAAGTYLNPVSSSAENYALGVNSRSVGSSGTCTAVNVASYNFDNITNANAGGVLSNSLYYPIASCDGTSTGSTVGVKEWAAITGSTPAASDYADTIYMTAAGQF